MTMYTIAYRKFYLNQFCKILSLKKAFDEIIAIKDYIIRIQLSLLI